MLVEDPALLQTLWIQRQIMIKSALRELTVSWERDIKTNQEETDRCQGEGEHRVSWDHGGQALNKKHKGSKIFFTQRRT